MTQVRSPNYPQIIAPGAITRVANFFSKDSR
jgi:hypothetical protein